MLQRRLSIVDVKFCCKVVRHVMSKSVSEMPLGGLVDFFCGGEIN